MMIRQRLWDLPTRLFHWLLVVSTVAAVVTGEIGGNLVDWHGRVGLFILGLIVFRVVWGFIGSSTARFANFVRGPTAIKAYLRGEWSGIGHNPLGALSVLCILIVVAAQASSGIFSNDDISFQGPLADLVGKTWSNHLSGLHHLLAGVVIALVLLHLAAIAYYMHIKKKNLLQPMLTGWQYIEPESATTTEVTGNHPAGKWHSTFAFVLAISFASITVFTAAGGFLSPIPPKTSTAPGW